MPRSTLWATETPTAEKLPISGANGKLANGWCHTNYADVVTVSVPTTLGAAHSIIIVSNGSQITLPTAVGITGRLYNIIRSGTANVHIAPTGSETISGDTSLTLTNQWDSVVLVADGTNWVRCS